ncbi:hypothetical protein O7S_00880, partial [Bartonella quintana JK 67]
GAGASHGKAPMNTYRVGCGLRRMGGAPWGVRRQTYGGWQKFS